ncbi:uncharacterized protein LOC121877214 [Homarus americanus]|uniref:uncharacterized protein LOC121877214 n=1 Tax=Homarus americanus TaxID=6706 RepID=UPI001C47FD19|nr:uncharacterized protein LOC121877214 [Homarus americanus]
MMRCVLLLVLCAGHLHPAATHDDHHQEMSSSLIVNQLAIMKMMGDTSNSCSAVPEDIMEKLEAQLQTGKEDLQTATTDILGQITVLKNNTWAGFEDLKEELRSVLASTKMR